MSGEKVEGHEHEHEKVPKTAAEWSKTSPFTLVHTVASACWIVKYCNTDCIINYYNI